jgi:hypothetical protein
MTIQLCCGVLLLTALPLAAQAPSLSGVWKADLDKSSFMGPKPTSYLVAIQQQGLAIHATSSSIGQHGEYRASLTYTTGSKEALNSWMGVPMWSKAQLQDGVLTVDSRLPGPHPSTMQETWTLSPDGQTLTIHTAGDMNGHHMEETKVLTKQPDEAGDALRKPEETAAAHYKNVKILTDLPASQFIDTMRYFTFSLGVRCEHCHVEHNFEADDKKEKLTARQMITMTHNVDQDTFKGRPEVRCYTCHRGAEKPVTVPE